ncbi:related to vacuolar membrane protein [Cephalotrichum gorgonifer]|uniref:Related to vacuolar membrane protein n=1 Tax=Cephalotrichum gorgonifer TaxID=2041049 RepID=A0AAE8MWL4_9PEZI|nr:related to vacuolar membrane protein [Cephalotrichum gorgonifer]
MSSPPQPAVLDVVGDIASATITSLAGPNPTTALTDAARLVASVVSTAAATAAARPTATGSPTELADSSGDCSLLGSFALLVQLALGGLALLSLVYKRWRERPQRPMKIWFFDVSKQVFGSVLVHVANVFMSMLTSGRVTFQSQPVGAVAVGRMLLLRSDDDGAYRPNPCSFYLLNLAIDTTLGIPILIFLLRIATSLASRTSFGEPPESILSGNYGSPPNWRWWLKQSLLYFCGLFGMKLVVLIMFYAFPWLSHVGDWALGWTEGNEKLQIVFVMMLFPLIMNAMQYYIIDSFIKKQPTAEHQRIPSDEPDEGGHGNGATGGDGRTSRERYDVPDSFEASSSSDGLGVENEEGDVRLHSSKHLAGRDGYDSDMDDEAPTVIGSSGSSRGSERGTLLPKSLYPAE